MSLKNINFFLSGKCYQCEGTEEECGKKLSEKPEDTAKLTLVDCGVGDCWAKRNEENGEIKFFRGCFNTTCTSETENESCRTIDNKKECVKCCKGAKCNTWFLDGKSTSTIIKPLANCVIILFMFVKLLN